MEYLKAVQIGALLRNCTWPVASYIAGVISIGLIYRDSVPNSFLKSWVVAGLLILVVEFGIVFARLRITQPLQSQFWKWAVHIGCICTGFFFASSLFFLNFAENTTQIIAHVVIYTLLVASIITGAAYYLTAYYLIFPLLITPAVLAVLYYAETSQYIFLIPLGLLLLGMHTFIIGFNAVFQKLIRSEEKTATLLDEVRVERDKANNAIIQKNEFLALASHDLRQPVHAIGLFVAALENHVDDKGLDILRHIDQSSNKMGSLFNSILDMSKLDANAVDNNPVILLLAKLLKESAPEFESLAAQKGIQFEIDCSADLKVNLDPVILHRIVDNLVTNAIKFSDNGVVQIVAAAVNAQTIKLDVIDQGNGISEKDIGKIFSEYHQLRNPDRDPQTGLGLGLSIVKRLCVLADIEISVESEPGEGSCFTLILPRAIATIPAVVVDNNNHNMRYRQFNIVVVDDEPEILEAMTVLLIQWGCTVFAGKNETEALSHFREHVRPNIVIADYRLNGEETGIDLIQKFRSIFGAQLPAILVTGDTTAVLLQEFVSSNIKVLHKPVLPKDLMAAVDEVMVDCTS